MPLRPILAAALAAVVLAGHSRVGPGAAPPADAGDGFRTSHEQVIRVHPRIGDRRIVVRSDAERIAVMIEIHRPGDPRPVQRLVAQAGEPPPGGRSPQAIAEDLDGDGYLDLRVLAWWGATGNAGYLAWRFDPATGAYVTIPDFEQLSQPKVDAATRCIRTRSNGGHLGAIFTAERWCWRGTRLELVWSRAQTSLPDGNYERVTRERRGAGMVEVERRRLTPESLERETETAP
jgi:hypothetical protein